MNPDQLARDLTGVLLRIGYHPRVQTVYTCEHCGALEKTGRDCQVCEERDYRCRDPWGCVSPCDETCHTRYPDAIGTEEASSAA